MSKFSEILKTTIESKGVTQKWVADAAQTSAANINRYIKEVNSPEILEILPRIAKVLEVSTDYLLGSTDNPNVSNLTIEEQIFLSCFRKASTDDAETLWVLLRKYMTANEKELLQQSEQNSKVG